MTPFLLPFQKKYNTECVIYSKIKTTIYMSKRIYAFKVGHARSLLPYKTFPMHSESILSRHMRMHNSYGIGERQVQKMLIQCVRLLIRIAHMCEDIVK